jgi:hypothetical protein
MRQKATVAQSQNGITSVRTGNDGNGMVWIAADSVRNHGLALHFGFEVK